MNRTPEQRNKSIWRWVVISVSVFALLLASGPAMLWLSNSPSGVVAAKGVQAQKDDNGSVTTGKNNGDDDKKTKEPKDPKPTKEAKEDKEPKPTKEAKEPEPTKEPKPTKEAKEPKPTKEPRPTKAPEPTKEPKENGGGCQFAILSFKACMDADRCAAYSIPLKNEGDTPITVNGTVVLEGRSNSQIGQGTIGDVVVPPKSTIYVEGSVCATQAGQGPYKLYVTINDIGRACESKHKQQPVKDNCAVAPPPAPTNTATAVPPTNTVVVPPTSTNTAVPTNTTAPATFTPTATHTVEATNTAEATNTVAPATSTPTSTATSEVAESTATQAATSTSTATASPTAGSGGSTQGGATLGGTTASNTGRSEVLPFVGGPATTDRVEAPREGVLGVSSEAPATTQANRAANAGLLPVTGALGTTLLLLTAGLALTLLGAGLILRRRRDLASAETNQE